MRSLYTLSYTRSTSMYPSPAKSRKRRNHSCTGNPACRHMPQEFASRPPTNAKPSGNKPEGRGHIAPATKRRTRPSQIQGAVVPQCGGGEAPLGPDPSMSRRDALFATAREVKSDLRARHRAEQGCCQNRELSGRTRSWNNHTTWDQIRSQTSVDPPDLDSQHHCALDLVQVGATLRIWMSRRLLLLDGSNCASPYLSATDVVVKSVDRKRVRQSGRPKWMQFSSPSPSSAAQNMNNSQT